MIIRQRDDDLRAFAARAGNRQFPAHLFDALPHSGQTETIMATLDFESVTVVAKLEAKFL